MAVTGDGSIEAPPPKNNKTSKRLFYRPVDVGALRSLYVYIYSLYRYIMCNVYYKKYAMNGR